MEKLKLHTPDLTTANIEKIAQLFPNCVVEAASAEDGSIKQKIDFDLLRQELNASIVEGPQERYQLNWPGKREALLTANLPIFKTLRPYQVESVNYETTQNLFIEGDNLDALKLLQESYLNKVKMIYIDPPYNTGSDFIYQDDFSEENDEYLERSQQRNDVGHRLVANTESNGRFHSDWLSMMYPRLKLARNLMREDGVIFISIDDKEQANLKRLCDEVFGEANFVAEFIWKKKPGGGNDSRYIVGEHEEIICYSKNLSHVNFFLDKNHELDDALYPFTDEKGEYGLVTLDKSSIRFSESLVFEIKSPDGVSHMPRVIKGKQSCWRWGRDKVLKDYEQLVFKNNNVYTKYYRPEGVIPKSLLIDSRFGRTETGKDDLKKLFGNMDFSYPKPVSLISHFISITTHENDIILDFFAGSATTAQAVIQLNATDGGKRKFVLVQIPESCDEKSEAFKAGYQNIADIGKQRVRLAGEAIKKESEVTAPDLDIGFRVLKIDTSNMKEVFYTPDAVSQDLLSDQINNIREDRTSEDLLFQVLLDWGVDLTLPITKEIIADKTVFFVDGNALAACFEVGISEEFVKQLAKREPLRVVFRDAGFASDSVKINVEQIFKLMSPATDIKTI